MLGLIKLLHTPLAWHPHHQSRGESGALAYTFAFLLRLCTIPAGSVWPSSFGRSVSSFSSGTDAPRHGPPLQRGCWSMQGPTGHETSRWDSSSTGTETPRKALKPLGRH